MEITISTERYTELIRAEIERDLILDGAKTLDADYKLGELAKVVLAPHMRSGGNAE